MIDPDKASVLVADGKHVQIGLQKAFEFYFLHHFLRNVRRNGSDRVGVQSEKRRAQPFSDEMRMKAQGNLCLAAGGFVQAGDEALGSLVIMGVNLQEASAD